MSAHFDVRSVYEGGTHETWKTYPDKDQAMADAEKRARINGGTFIVVMVDENIVATISGSIG